jgi:ATP-dependent RNA helicase RhlB
MDFQRFGIDPRLAQAAEGLPTSFFFYEKMLVHAVEMQENVCVKIALDEGREEVLLLPALQWLLSGDGRKALVVVPDAASAERCASAIGRLGSDAGLSVARVVRAAQGEAKDEGAVELVRLEGESSASVLIGVLEDLLAAPGLDLHDFGFLVVDGVDRLAELSSDIIRKFCGALLPSWERRSVLACARFSVKAKNLAWDLADNPSEISIEGEVAKAQSVLKETWNVPAEAKLKFLLGLLDREKPSRLCVFCNIKDTASEVSRRLAANGISTDSILGSLLPERKFALIEKFRAGDCTCLVLTDEGAEGLSPGVFPLIVNYDFPLEPEFFVKRLEMLDRSDPVAKVVSLACDRYIAGLPAVEQYIDAKLDALPADESMLSAIDKSEGMGKERRPRGEAYPRDARRGAAQRREAYPRDPHSRDVYPRDDTRREGRSPDIRKSISEATGGALDMSGALPPDSGYPRPASARTPSSVASSQGEPRRGQDHRGQVPIGGRVAGNKDGRRDAYPREDTRREDTRRDDSRRGNAKPSSQHGPTPRGSASRQQPPRPQAAKPGNPYDMPMEERMKLYREKYGRGIGDNKTGAGQSGSRNDQHNGQGNAPRGEPKGRQGRQQNGPKASRNGQQGSAQQIGGAQRPPAKRSQDPRSQGQSPSRPASLPNTPRVQQQPPQTAERKSEGVVGRFLGAFKKKAAK